MPLDARTIYLRTCKVYALPLTRARVHGTFCAVDKRKGFAMRNTWTKTRKREDAYYVGRTGSWTWYVLKVWSDPRKPYARAFCCVVSPIVGERGELGDVYTAEIPGLIEAWEAAHASQA